MLRRGPTMELLYRSNAPDGDLGGPAAVSSPPPVRGASKGDFESVPGAETFSPDQGGTP